MLASYVSLRALADCLTATTAALVTMAVNLNLEFAVAAFCFVVVNLLVKFGQRYGQRILAE
jgi:hypothetical protein